MSLVIDNKNWKKDDSYEVIRAIVVKFIGRHINIKMTYSTKIAIIGKLSDFLIHDVILKHFPYTEINWMTSHSSVESLV